MSIRVVPSATRGEDLGLTAGEQRRAVHARRDVDLGLDRPDLVLGAAVGPLLVDRDPPADDVLLELRERAGDLGGLLGVDLALDRGGGELGQRLLLDLVDRVLAGQLLLHLGGVVELRAVAALDPVDERLVELGDLDLDLLLAGLLAQLLHRADQRLDLAVGDVERVQHLGLGDAVGAALDHQDRLVGPGDDQVHLELGERLLLGVDDEVAVELADADGADVLGDRHRRDRERGGGAVHRQDVVGVDVVDRERLRDQLGLEVPALREQRPDRPVDHPRRQRRLLTGARLAAEE